MLKLQSHYSLILTTVVLAWQPTKDQASRRANNAVLNVSGGGGGGGGLWGTKHFAMFMLHNNDDLNKFI